MLSSGSGTGTLGEQPHSGGSRIPSRLHPLGISPPWLWLQPSNSSWKNQKWGEKSGRR